MKIKTNKRGIIITIALIFAFMFVMSTLGLTEFSSGIKLGYISHKGFDYWSAEYTQIDGTFSRTLKPKDESGGVLTIKTQTIEGNMGVYITDNDGNIIYENENVGTAEYKVYIEGKVKIKITADKHKGSFDFEIIYNQM